MSVCTCPKNELGEIVANVTSCEAHGWNHVKQAPTFFPPEVQRAINRLALAVDGGFESEVVNDSYMLLRELRDWERKWRAGEARLVPQVEAKANGEGGL